MIYRNLYNSLYDKLYKEDYKMNEKQVSFEDFRKEQNGERLGDILAELKVLK